MKLPCRLKGTVVHGKALGRTVGMPTANLKIYDTELPQSGVYVTRIHIGQEVFDSVTNIGTRPSVDSAKDITVETYIFDFKQDIYGTDVVLEVLEFLRPVQKFADLGQVQEQVQKDIANAKLYLGQSEEDKQ